MSFEQQQEIFEDQLRAQRKDFETRIREQQASFEARIRVQQEEFMDRMKIGQIEAMARMEKLESALTMMKKSKSKKSVNFCEMVGLVHLLSVYNRILFSIVLMMKVRQPSALSINHSPHY